MRYVQLRLFKHGVQHRMVLVDNFFRIFQIIIFCFVADMCDLVHDVEAIHWLCYLLPASGNVFWNMSDAYETAILQFHGHHSYFRKHFQMLVAAKEGEI